MFASSDGFETMSSRRNERPSVTELQLAKERTPPGIGAQRAEERVDLGPEDPRIPLRVRPLEPLECKVRLAPRRVRLGDLIGGLASKEVRGWGLRFPALPP